MIDLTLSPQPDGLTYALGAPTEDPATKAATRFLTQFLSVFRVDTGRGTVFMTALNQGKVKTNADIITLVATAGAQIRTIEGTFLTDAVLQSIDLLKAEFIDGTKLKLTVRLNTVQGSTVNDIEVA